MGNIFDTRKDEDTLRKTCAEHSEVAQFVKNILDLEETDNTPEKITWYPNFVHFVAFLSSDSQFFIILILSVFLGAFQKIKGKKMFVWRYSVRIHTKNYVKICQNSKYLKIMFSVKILIASFLSKRHVLDNFLTNQKL